MARAGAPRVESEAVRREQLLRAARHVFATHGYGRTAVADVVREAGVAQGTFYLYFPSKQAAFIALYRQLADAYHLALFDPGLEELPFLRRVEQQVRRSFAVARTNPDLVRLCHLQVDPESEEAELLAASWTPTVEALEEQLRRAIAAGEARPADVPATARVLVAAVEAAMFLSCCRADLDPARIEDETVETVLRAVRPDRLWRTV